MLARSAAMGEDCGMTPTDHPAAAPASLEEIQKEWVELKLKVGGLEAGQEILEKENKTLRFLLERTIEHRQKSHGELVLILAGLVGKLPINDVGFTVSKLVEHNAHVSEILTTLLKGKAEEGMPQPASLKQFEQTKRDLALALTLARDAAQESARATQAGIESAKAALDSDLSAVGSAKLNLNYCQIRSPLSGRTGNLLVHAGNLVKANDVPL